MDLDKYSRELHRRRIVAGSKQTYSQTEFEMKTFSELGLVPTIDNLYLNKYGLFLSGIYDNKTFVIYSMPEGSTPVLIDDVFDVYLFCGKLDDDSYGIMGWIPNEELVEAPVVDDKVYFVTKEHLFTFKGNFKAPCESLPCDGAAIWDWDCDSWSCFDCGKMRYDSNGREWSTAYYAKPSDKNEESEKEPVG